MHFIGATLWTDFRLDGVAGEAWAHLEVGQGTRRLHRRYPPPRGTRWGVHDARSAWRHAEHRAFIEAELEKARASGLTAVVIIEVVTIDTTGALRLSAVSLPVGPISERSRELHGLSEEALHAMGARQRAEVHPELLSTLRDAAAVLAWRADFDAPVLAQTAALHHRLTNAQESAIPQCDAFRASTDGLIQGTRQICGNLGIEGVPPSRPRARFPRSQAHPRPKTGGLTNPTYTH